MKVTDVFAASSVQATGAKVDESTTIEQTIKINISDVLSESSEE